MALTSPCPLHLQSPGPAPFRGRRDRRRRPHRTPGRKAAGIRERRSHRRHLLHQGRQGAQGIAPVPHGQRHPHPRRVPADRRTPDDDREGLQVPHRPRAGMARLRPARDADTDKHLAAAKQRRPEQREPGRNRPERDHPQRKTDPALHHRQKRNHRELHHRPQRDHRRQLHAKERDNNGLHYVG